VRRPWGLGGWTAPALRRGRPWWVLFFFLDRAGGKETAVVSCGAVADGPCSRSNEEASSYLFWAPCQSRVLVVSGRWIWVPRQVSWCWCLVLGKPLIRLAGHDKDDASGATLL
jgi:hypothetical protein